MTRAMRSPVRTPSAGAADEDLPSFGSVAGDLDAKSGGSGRPNYAAIQRSEDFAQLRRSLRRFVFPMTALFLAWYLAYVLLAAFDHELMSRKLAGEINVGLVFGVLQFVSTILIMMAYLRFAKRRIDPQVDAIRKKAGVVEE
jgi:uncharacterized membrane protein (DUF485 family)